MVIISSNVKHYHAISYTLLNLFPCFEDFLLDLVIVDQTQEILPKVIRASIWESKGQDKEYPCFSLYESQLAPSILFMLHKH